MSPAARRLLILVLALIVVALNVALYEPDPFAWIILALVDVFLLLCLISAWRRVTQDELDRARTAERRAAQRDE